MQLPTKAPPRGASKAVLASAKPGAASPVRENGVPTQAEERQGLPPLSVQQPAGPYPHAETSGGQLSPLGQGQQARVFAPGGVHLQYMFFTTEEVKGQTLNSLSTVQYVFVIYLLLFVCHLCVLIALRSMSLCFVEKRELWCSSSRHVPGGADNKRAAHGAFCAWQPQRLGRHGWHATSSHKSRYIPLQLPSSSARPA